MSPLSEKIHAPRHPKRPRRNPHEYPPIPVPRVPQNVPRQIRPNHPPQIAQRSLQMQILPEKVHRSQQTEAPSTHAHQRTPVRVQCMRPCVLR